MKKVLVMCTGNSCRSIIGEALINAFLDGVEAYSCGVNPTRKVNPNAKKVLEDNNIWSDEYHSKNLDEVMDEDFDLVVTVCDNAKKSCPTFPKPTPKIHIGFDDPDGKGFEAFEKTYKEIKERLLPKVKEELFGKKKIDRDVFKTAQGVKINFSGAVAKNQIIKMVENCSTGQCECMSDDTKKKIQNMQVSGSDGDVKLDLHGDISKEEIEEALKKSKVINHDISD